MVWFVVSFFLALILGAGVFFGYPAYQDWQANRSVALAKSSWKGGDLRSAVLSLQAALRRRPNHLEAHRTAASLLEASGSPEALLHWRKIVEAEPDSPGPKLEFARCAINLSRLDEAEGMLNSIGQSGRTSREFLALQGELFSVRGQLDRAIATYRELIRLFPEDSDEAQTRLAILELTSNSEQERASARKELEAFASGEKNPLLAARALARDALTRRDLPAALRWSEQSAAMPKAEFSDQLLRLQALFLAKDPRYERWLSTVEKKAEEDPRFAFALGKWELASLDPNKAASWLESLPKNVKDRPLIGVLLADSYSALQRWTDLESLVRWANWRDLESLRLAFLARAQSGLGNAQKSDRTWELALAAAESQPGQAAPLLAMAREENRDVHKLLWMVVEHDPRQVWARKELYESYLREKNADQMLRMMELILKENPSDQSAKYNVAGLLMVTGRDIARAERLAGELYEADSRNLENAVLYAFGIKLRGEPEKAAKMLDGRRDLDQLGNEGRAFYALILFDCGRRDEASRVAEAVDRQALLPQLRASLDQIFQSVSPAG